MAVFNKAVLAIVLVSAVCAVEIPELGQGRGFYYDSESQPISLQHSRSEISEGSEPSMSNSELETSLSYGDVYGHNSKDKSADDISVSFSVDVPNYKPQKCPELEDCKKQFKSVTKMIDLLQDEKESTMRLIKTKLYKSKDLEEEISGLKHKNHNIANKINMQMNKLKSQDQSLTAQMELLHEIKETSDHFRELVHNQAETCERKLKGVKLEEGPFGIYHFSEDDMELKNWHQARDYCRQRGMNLATANTAAENIWLTARVGELIDDASSSAAGNTAYWFGLNNLARHFYFNFNTYDTKHSTWYWFATGTESTYYTWADSEPSDKSYTSSEGDFDSESTSNEYYYQQCVNLDVDNENNGAIRWFDNDCYNEYKFICELDDPCPLKKHIAQESNDSSGGSIEYSVSQETASIW